MHRCVPYYYKQYPWIYTISSLEPWKWHAPVLFSTSTSEPLRYWDCNILSDRLVEYSIFK